jgi:carbon storage regulator
MLVLSRRKNESIVIGEGIVVKVVGIKGKTIQLGISAPKEIPVHRKEIHERIEFKMSPHPKPLIGASFTG